MNSLSEEQARLLQRTLLLCCDAHYEQRDKAGLPYVLHPLRMALRIVPSSANFEQIILSLLHDSLEDLQANKLGTEVAFRSRIGQIIAALSPEARNAMKLLTRKNKESYFDYIDRIAASNNKLAIAVKRGDIEDNITSWRLALLSKKQQASLHYRYITALQLLGRKNHKSSERSSEIADRIGDQEDSQEGTEGHDVEGREREV